MAPKAFTVAEANALIPDLERVLEGIRARIDTARSHHEKLQILEVLWGEKVKDLQNPDHQEAVIHSHHLAEAVQDTKHLIEREIRDRGVRFPQGGLVHGLLDFPTTWDGRWVYLCWRSGEPEIGAWHEVDAGFRGRRALTAEQARRMGREDDPAEIDDSHIDW